MLRDRLARSSFPLFALASLALSSCGLLTRPEAGVQENAPGSAFDERQSSALTSAEPSDATAGVLRELGLHELFDADPARAIELLHARVLDEPRRRDLFALAECSYLLGGREAAPERYLAAAIYAYYYLLGWEAPEPANPFDRRYRWACDLYARGLTEALRREDGTLQLDARRDWELAAGRLSLALDAPMLESSVEERSFVPADDLRVYGLPVRPRDDGLGVPLVAVGPRADPAEARLRADRSFVPLTLLLELDGGLRRWSDGLHGRLVLRSSFAVGPALLHGRRVPVEVDLAGPFALGLEGSSLWDLSIDGFFAANAEQNRIARLTPYVPGRVPVVFVHGTASSAAYWAAAVASLVADPELRDRIQVWMFAYTTGNPILYSAATLRDALRQQVRTLDPSGTDEALRSIVLVGHSQGGLLARLAVMDGELSWWDRLVGTPLENWHLPEDQLALVRRALDFEPVAEVDSVVFVATPHRGSFVAGKPLALFVSRWVNVSEEVAALTRSLRERRDELPEALADAIPNSVHNMDPSSPFSHLMASEPIVRGVKVHSIVAVRGAGPVAAGDDGVVEYSSAHLDAADSELVVRSGHSCQSRPETVLELTRILREAVGLPSARPLRTDG